jgi:hypothetical protein
VTICERTAGGVRRSSRQQFSLVARLTGLRPLAAFKVMRARGEVRLGASWFVLAR